MPNRPQPPAAPLGKWATASVAPRILIVFAALQAVGPEPKTPAAPSCNCAFQAVIWCGCTSNSLVSSESVLSPLIAARATFALKPGLCARRVRFVMFAPEPRQHCRCQAGNPPIGLFEFPEPSLPGVSQPPRGLV